MANFTDFYIKNLKPREKLYRESEGRSGFCITVAPTGTKTFIYRYKHNGKDAAVTLGKYKTDVTLQQARDKYELARNAVRDKKDPKLALNPPAPESAPPEVMSSDGITIRELMELYITQWSEKYHSKRWSRANRLCLEKDLIPEWGDKKATDMRPRDAYRLVDSIAARAPATARNIIKAGKKMFAYGLRNEHVEINPFGMDDFVQHTPTIRPKVGERIMSEEEIRFIWKAVEEGPGTPEVKRAIKLVLVTAQRPVEVSGMLYSEIEGDWWTIPPCRIKTENKVGLDHEPRPHMVYLTPLAKELIGEKGWSGDIVFPAIKGNNQDRKGPFSGKKKAKGINLEDLAPLDPNALNKRISRRDVKGPKGNKVVVKEPYYGLPEWSPHDLRRTADTMMNSIGIDHRHVEMVLNHSLGKVEGTYNKYQYNPEKKAALIKWEAKLREVLGT